MKKITKICICLIIIIISIYAVKKLSYNLVVNQSQKTHSLQKVDSNNFNKDVKYVGKTNFLIEKLVLYKNKILIKWDKEKYEKIYKDNHDKDLIVNNTKFKFIHPIEYYSKSNKIKISDSLNLKYVDMFYINELEKNEIKLLVDDGLDKINNKEVLINWQGETSNIGIAFYSIMGYVIEFDKNYLANIIFYENDNQLYTFISYGDEYYKVKEEEIKEYISILSHQSLREEENI